MAGRRIDELSCSIHSSGAIMNAAVPISAFCAVLATAVALVL
jgi:hypothetical protein